MPLTHTVVTAAQTALLYFLDHLFLFSLFNVKPIFLKLFGLSLVGFTTALWQRKKLDSKLGLESEIEGREEKDMGRTKQTKRDEKMKEFGVKEYARLLRLHYIVDCLVMLLENATFISFITGMDSGLVSFPSISSGQVM